MLVSMAAALFLCVVAGPFRTDMLAIPTRTLFWGVLIGLNGLKWWAWYRFGAPRAPAGRGGALGLALAGAVVLNLTLPLEIGFMYRAVGKPVEIGWLGLFLMAALISLAISAVIAVARSGQVQPVPPLPPPPAVVAVGGLAARVDLASVQLLIAEDHYVRLHLASGQRPLILYRFGDALVELAGRDGERVHRGAWVAGGAVVRCRRDGRRWKLVLKDGAEVPVSETYLPAVRARGWLAMR